KNSSAERNYLIPPPGHSKWTRALRRVLKAENVNLIIATIDADVSALSRARPSLRGHLFLPRRAMLEACADKYRLITFLRAKGVDAPATAAVTDLDHIDRIFRRVATRSKVWCRIRRGSGGLGAIPVTTPEQARSWIQYWQDMRGVPVTSF